MLLDTIAHTSQSLEVTWLRLLARIFCENYSS